MSVNMFSCCSLAAGKSRPVYVRYNRYTSVYPFSSVGRHSRVSRMGTTVTSPGGVIVFRATPTMHINLNRRFNLSTNAFMRNGVITTLHGLNNSCVLSAGFNTSVAVVRRTSRLLRHIVGDSTMLPRFASYYPT